MNNGSGLRASVGNRNSLLPTRRRGILPRNCVSSMVFPFATTLSVPIRGTWDRYSLSQYARRAARVGLLWLRPPG